uniref:Ribosomal protein S3 n=1 Tax=Stratiotes aloides TaxID=55494 RepID=A0A1Z1R251_9LILI|nr:ribosomal protein S3 [Stratiotes aloides]ARX11203.1 ribosomal protein S3 [Stratiotes aloides]
MARKGNPISVRLSQNRSSDPSRFSDYYYGKSVYQDVNLRSDFGSIRPPTISTFGFRLGRCLLLRFPKGTFIHFFLPRGPLRLKRGDESRPGKEKGQWWAFRKVGPIGCLHSSKSTEEERTDVRGRGAFGGAECGGLRREKQNEIRIWPRKMQGYGVSDRVVRRSPSRKKNPYKSLRGASVHPKDLGLFNYRDFLIENDDSLRKTKFFQFFLQNQSRSDGPRSHLLKRTLPAALNYSVMQYWRNTKNKMHFDPVGVLNHFVAPGVSEPSTMRGAKRGVKHRIRSRIAFFVESSTSEKKCLAQAKKRPKIAGTTKTTISLFPFFGATFFFPRDGVGSTLKGREELWSQLSQKCWNLMGQDKVMELIEKCRELGSTREFLKGIEILIVLRNRKIPYGYNSYLNEVKKMRSFLSERTKTETSIESVKIKSVYQSASPIAQDISFQPRNKRISFRSIFSHIVKADVVGVEGIRICCSGRSEGAEISRTECGKYGKTSRNVLEQKIDYAPAEVSTRYGILGVKVWISYR